MEKKEKLEAILVIAEKALDRVIKDYGVKEDIKEESMTAARESVEIDVEYAEMEEDERATYLNFYVWFMDLIFGEFEGKGRTGGLQNSGKDRS